MSVLMVGNLRSQFATPMIPTLVSARAAETLTRHFSGTTLLLFLITSFSFTETRSFLLQFWTFIAKAGVIYEGARDIQEAASKDGWTDFAFIAICFFQQFSLFTFYLSTVSVDSCIYLFLFYSYMVALLSLLPITSKPNHTWFELYHMYQ